MKLKSKKLIVLVIMIGLFVIMSGLKVEATTTATAELKTDKVQVNPGESFTVTLAVSSEQGLNGVIGKLEYNTEKLEIEKTEINNKWLDLSGGDNKKIELMYNNTETSKSEDVYKITFKVKSGVTGTVEIKVDELEIDTMASGDSSTVKLGRENVTIKIGTQQGEEDKKELTNIKITKAPSKVEYTEGESFNKTGMEVKACYSDGTEQVITNYTVTNGEKLAKNQTSVTISYTEGGVTKTATQEIKIQNKDNTTSDKELPNTGVKVPVLGGIVVMFITAIVSVIKIKRLSGI